MTDPQPDPTPEVAHGELVAHGPEAVEPAEADERREAVEEPAKVMRIGSMIKQLLDEVRQADLDGPARERLKAIYDSSIQEVGQALSPDLRAELERVAIPFGDDSEPSDAELRIAQAQLVGWLEGLFHGIQTAIAAQQAANQHLAARLQMRQLPPGTMIAPGVVIGEDGEPHRATGAETETVPGPAAPREDGRHSGPGQYL